MGKLIRINDITEQELRDIEALDRECFRLHLPPMPKTFLQLDVHMPGGEHVLEYKTRSKSWTRNAYNVFVGHALGIQVGTGYQAGSLQIKDTNASVAFFNYGLTISQGGLGSTFGIVVGTGTAAESFEGYALAALILHGTTTGKLSYAAQNAASGSYNAGTKKWTSVMVRLFNNNSGAQIDVAEAGMYYSAGYAIMTFRDLLESPVAVANTAQLTVTYTMEYTMPA